MTASRERELKTQLTQDLSYSITNESILVNDRIDIDQYAKWFMAGA
jgi:hypothetical protein